MRIDFSIKKGTTVPAVESQLTDGAGVVNLLDASVAFWMRSLRDGSVKVDNAPAEIIAEEASDLSTPDAPNVRYQWSADDVDAAGLFEAQWVVTYEGGAVQRFPTDPERPYVVIEVQP